MLDRCLPRINYSIEYNPNLDGLRGLSILLVLLFHFFPEIFPFGFIGVDIFFVVSGYLITKIIYQNFNNGKFSLLIFYRNRIRRLLPALIVILIFNLFIGFLFLFPDEYSNLGKHVKSSALYYQNFQLMRELGYWDKSALLKPLLHLWSLSIEEQFYLVWPLIILLLLSVKNKKFIKYSIVIFCFFLLYISHLFIKSNLEKYFYHTIARSWELILGGSIAVNEDELIKLSCFKKTDKKYIYVLLYASLIFLLLILNIKVYEPLKIFLFLIIIVLLILRSLSYEDYFLSNKILIFFGLISYSLYLWHFSLLSFLFIFGFNNFWMKLFIMLFSIMISFISLKFIELPFRRIKNVKGILVLLIFIFFIGIIGDHISSLDGWLGRPIERKYEVISHEFIRGIPKEERCIDLSLKILNNPIKFDYCRSTTNYQEKIKIAIIGDSHADVFGAGLIDFLKKNNVDCVILANSGCPPYVNSYMGRNEEEIKNCSLKIKQIYKIINNLNNLKAIIFISRHSIYAKGTGFGDIEGEYNKNPHKYFECCKNYDSCDNEYLFLKKMDDTFKYFIDKNIKIFFVLENPEIGFDPKKCIKRWFLPEPLTCRIPYNVFIERSGKIREEIKKIAEKYNNIEILDPKEIFCNGVYCNVMINNHTLYIDDDHISLYASELFANLVGGKIIDSLKKIK